MKNEDLLNAFGEIDDRFIEEADTELSADFHSASDVAAAKKRISRVLLYQIAGTTLRLPLLSTLKKHSDNLRPLLQTPASLKRHKSHPQNPRLISTLKQSGSYLGSSKKDGCLYTCSLMTFGRNERGEPYVNGKPVTFEDICCYEAANQNSYLVITSAKADDDTLCDKKAVFGGTENFYLSSDAIYCIQWRMASQLLLRCGRADEDPLSGRNIYSLRKS